MNCVQNWFQMIGSNLHELLKVQDNLRKITPPVVAIIVEFHDTCGESVEHLFAFLAIFSQAWLLIIVEKPTKIFIIILFFSNLSVQTAVMTINLKKFEQKDLLDLRRVRPKEEWPLLCNIWNDLYIFLWNWFFDISSKTFFKSSTYHIFYSKDFPGSRHPYFCVKSNFCRSLFFSQYFDEISKFANLIILNPLKLRFWH